MRSTGSDALDSRYVFVFPYLIIQYNYNVFHPHIGIHGQDITYLYTHYILYKCTRLISSDSGGSDLITFNTHAPI